MEIDEEEQKEDANEVTKLCVCSRGPVVDGKEKCQQCLESVPTAIESWVYRMDKVLVDAVTAQHKTNKVKKYWLELKGQELY